MKLVQNQMQQIRRRWRAALRSGSLILLIAFLPMSAYLGHWGEFTDYAFGRQGNERPADPDHSHAGHCHGVSSCSDQQPPIVMRIIPSVVDVPKPAFIDHAVDGEAFVVGEIFIAPPTEPPQI